MGDKTKGLMHRYDVKRVDGSDQRGGRHEQCELFVLDLTHDPFAIPAIASYIMACEAEYPLLAADLRRLHGLKIELYARVHALVKEGRAKESDLRRLEAGLLAVAAAAGVKGDRFPNNELWLTKLVDTLRAKVHEFRTQATLSRFDRRNRGQLRTARKTRRRR